MEVEQTRIRTGPSLGTRAFLITAMVVVAAVGAAVAVTLFLGRRVADREVRATLQRAASAQEAVRRLEAERLPLVANYLATDPAFVAYVAQSLEVGDRLSILDQLEQRQGDLGYDFAIVTDPAGQLVASTAAPDAAREDLAADPLLLQAREQYQGQGVWLHRDRLYQAVAVPIDAGDLLVGFLFAGFALDDVDALALRNIGEAEVLFLRRGNGAPEPVAGTLDDARTAGVVAALAARGERWLEDSDTPFALSVAGQPWLALARPLLDAGGTPVGTAVSLASPATRLAPFRRLATILLGVGLAAILLGLLPAFLLTRRVLDPVNRLADAARAAADGDYDQTLVTERRDEVGALAGALDSLLAELREKRDMERYINQLSRNLPEPAAAARPTVAPARATTQTVAVVLGIEARGGAPDPAPGEEEGEAEARLERRTEPLRRVAGAIQAHGGTVETFAGGRLLASFAGEDRTARALAAAAAVLDAPPPGAGSPAAALAAGEVLAGGVRWLPGTATAVTGAAVDELERLLRVAKPGDLLLGRSTYGDLAGLCHRSGVALERLPGFEPSLPLYALDRATVERLVGSALQATWAAAPAATAPRGAETATRVLPGQVVGARFEILSVLGQGGMGVVYKAHDRELDELVAVKMIRTGSGGVDAEQLERLKRELKLARKITHPNIVRTFDFGEVGGVPFITMEYVHGITLQRLIGASGALPLSAGLRLSRQLCRGLEVAHGEGVLHRDIKPENLIVEPNGNAKLMDFGIARPLVRGLDDSGQTAAGSVIGTPFYLAPEQVRGEEPDARADLYACGVVFYEIFTGKLPFPIEGSPVQVMMRKLNEEPVPPRERWPGMPATLAAIIERCLRRDPADRYPDVATLLADLEACRA